MFQYFLIPALALTAGSLQAEDVMPHHQNMKAEHMQHMKARMAKHHAETEGKIAQKRAASDAHRNECHTKMQAATTPEEMKAIRAQCHTEGQAMHEANKAERQAWKQKMHDKRREMKAQRQEFRQKGKEQAQ